MTSCTQRCSASPTFTVESSKVSYFMLNPRNMLQFFLLLLLLISGTLCTNVKEIRVPHPGVVGRPATLECVYDDADKENYYSTRWYLNGKQFYSFIKHNDPEKFPHNHTDVNVDLEHSDPRKVTISEITAKAEGLYKCEVMGEAPLFETDSVTQNLIVIKLPDALEIRGVQSSYRVGDNLEATCTASHSWPSSTIYFTSNGVPVDSSHVRSMGVSQDKELSYFPKGSFTSTSMLLLQLESHYGSSIRIGCHARVQSEETASYVKVRVDSGLSSEFSFNAGTSPLPSNPPVTPSTLKTTARSEPVGVQVARNQTKLCVCGDDIHQSVLKGTDICGGSCELCLERIFSWGLAIVQVGYWTA